MGSKSLGKEIIQMKLGEVNPWQDLFKRESLDEVGIVIEAYQIPSRHMLKTLCQSGTYCGYER